ncbi:MAG TPA: XRE family transcriptional regulator [Pseudonocardiaceae bacterium]|nr:XRE family transcriptional regulator [Pseudonocardiaceae bacterium]
MTARSGSPAASGVSRRGRPTTEAGAADVPVPADHRDAIMSVGAKLRERRLAAGVSLRQFARDLGVSPSLVSQIENGKSQPSVATLYMICSRLDVSIDELFSNAAPADAPAQAGERNGTDDGDTHTFRGALAKLNEPHQRGTTPVVEPHQRRRLVLDSGVTWEQLSSAHESNVDFLLVHYEVGGSSVPGEHLTRHSGIEYGYIISGTLDVSLGFETYQLRPGDSISFDSATPHRLTNNGDVPVEAIWFVHGRNHEA